MKTIVMKLNPVCLLALCAVSAFAQPSEEPVPREQRGAPVIGVSQAKGVWTIQGRKQTVTLNAQDLALAIQAGPSLWKMVPSGPADMRVKFQGKEFDVRLADARKISI